MIEERLQQKKQQQQQQQHKQQLSSTVPDQYKVNDASVSIISQSQQQQQQHNNSQIPVSTSIVDQCNQITAAVSALDKDGSDLFAAGQYQEASIRFEKALELKRQSLINHSTAWQLYMNEQQGSSINSTGEEGVGYSAESNNCSSTIPNSFSLLKSHPTYVSLTNNEQNVYTFGSKIATGQQSSSAVGSSTNKSSIQEVVDDDDDDKTEKDYKRNLIASVATSINNLTFLKQQNGQCSSEETLASYMQSLQMKLQVLGPNHLSVGKTLNNIGSVFYIQKKYPASLQAYMDAYRIMKRSLGIQHLDVATVASNIGDSYRCMNNIDNALGYYKIALDIRWEMLPHNHPKIFRLMEQTAELELLKGNPDYFHKFKFGRRRSSSSSSSSSSTSTSSSKSSMGNEQDGTRTLTRAERRKEKRRNRRMNLFDDSSIKSRHLIKQLKANTAEDMQFIEELERQAAIDVVMDKIIVSNEMESISLAGPKGTRTTNVVVPDLERDQRNHIAITPDNLAATKSVHHTTPNSNKSSAIEEEEHTIDTSDLAIINTNNSFDRTINNSAHGQRSSINTNNTLSTPRKNLFGTVNSSSSSDHNRRNQIGVTYSYSSEGGNITTSLSNEQHDLAGNNSFSGDDHRQMALEAVKGRLDQIRALRRDEGGDNINTILLGDEYKNSNHGKSFGSYTPRGPNSSGTGAAAAGTTTSSRQQQDGITFPVSTSSSQSNVISSGPIFGTSPQCASTQSTKYTLPKLSFNGIDNGEPAIDDKHTDCTTTRGVSAVSASMTKDSYKNQSNYYMGRGTNNNKITGNTNGVKNNSRSGRTSMTSLSSSSTTTSQLPVGRSMMTKKSIATKQAAVTTTTTTTTKAVPVTPTTQPIRICSYMGPTQSSAARSNNGNNNNNKSYMVSSTTRRKQRQQQYQQLQHVLAED